MRINGMSSARHVESILRLANSWRWDDLNEYQQRLYEAGNRGWRNFSEVNLALKMLKFIATSRANFNRKYRAIKRT